ncbi:MAG: sodium:solute symporter [Thermoanaerobaculales bacterium]
MIWWAAPVVAVLAFALWGLRRTRSAEDFFVASRNVGPVVAGLGGTAAGLSAFVFVGGPGYFAAVGAASLWIILSAPLTGALQCWAVGERIVDLVDSHGCLTVPDLVTARFGGGWPRGLTATAVVVGAIATLAVQVKGTAVIGEVLVGGPGWLVAAGAVVATVIYTAAGGMRTGILAEAAQGVVMAGSAVAIAAFALGRAGGPRQAVATIAELRPALLEPWGRAGPTAAIGLFLLFALGTCAQPHYLQKFLLLRDRASLRWMPAVMTVALLAVLTVWIGVGIGGTALWLRGELVLKSPDQLASVLLASAGSRAFTAMTAVAVIAAVMSTAASLLNLAAAAITRDLPRALGFEPTSRLLPARIATLGVGVASAVLALVWDRSVVLLGVLGWGTFTAALLPVMVIGLGWQEASRRGAVAALVLGPAVQLAAEWARGHSILVSRWEPGLAGAAVGAIVLVVVSLLWPDDQGR